ncbi:MAG: hypothetical protein ABEK59_01890 [Halobacteria archaeon]
MDGITPYLRRKPGQEGTEKIVLSGLAEVLMVTAPDVLGGENV